ncbi:MAG: CTP synthase [Nocardioidaceae bacterium]|nr:CTP synthase [Nocardioidaceae bacterium]
MPRIALVGEDRGHRSHQELNALRPLLDSETTWVATDSGTDLAAFDGIWLVPGSPYADDEAAYRAVTHARLMGTPFLGTCGGMQYAVVELARSLLGRSATHAESDGEGPDNAVTPLACALQGAERAVVPVAGTRFATLVSEPFQGMHFCSYAPTPEVVAALTATGAVEVGATADDAGAEVLTLLDHPFFVLSLFQPHVGTLAGAPVHPLVTAFVEAVHRVS